MRAVILMTAVLFGLAACEDMGMMGGSANKVAPMSDDNTLDDDESNDGDGTMTP